MSYAKAGTELAKSIHRKKIAKMQPKKCHLCGAEFQPNSYSAIYCGKRCAMNAKNMKISTYRRVQNISDMELVARMDRYLKEHACVEQRPLSSPITATPAWLVAVMG